MPHKSFSCDEVEYFSLPQQDRALLCDMCVM